MLTREKQPCSGLWGGNDGNGVSARDKQCKQAFQLSQIITRTLRMADHIN